jgi:hypothetical protein
VPRGCLLRRVNADVAAGDALEDPLLMAGYRPDRASVWALEARRPDSCMHARVFAPRASACRVATDVLPARASGESCLTSSL